MFPGDLQVSAGNPARIPPRELIKAGSDRFSRQT
jgi:hypothetical protein